MIRKNTLFVDRSVKQVAPGGFILAQELYNKLSAIATRIGVVDECSTGDAVCDAILAAFDGITLASVDKRSLIDLAHEIRLSSTRAHRLEGVIDGDESPCCPRRMTMKMMFFEKGMSWAFFMVETTLIDCDSVVRSVTYSYPEWSPTAEV